jgi:hypothetical protein
MEFLGMYWTSFPELRYHICEFRTCERRFYLAFSNAPRKIELELQGEHEPAAPAKAVEAIKDEEADKEEKSVEKKETQENKDKDAKKTKVCV